MVKDNAPIIQPILIYVSYDGKEAEHNIYYEFGSLVCIIHLEKYTIYTNIQNWEIHLSVDHQVAALLWNRASKRNRTRFKQLSDSIAVEAMAGGWSYLFFRIQSFQIHAFIISLT